MGGREREEAFSFFKRDAFFTLEFKDLLVCLKDGTRAAASRVIIRIAIEATSRRKALTFVGSLTAIFASAAEGAPFHEMIDSVAIDALHRAENVLIDDKAVTC